MCVAWLPTRHAERRFQLLERADHSKASAKVIVTSDVLERLRPRQHDSTDSFDVEDEELLQMEEMEEGATPTIGDRLLHRRLQTWK